LAGRRTSSSPSRKSYLPGSAPDSNDADSHLSSNFAAVPVIYFLFPETGYRSLEEVDVIFHAASLGPNPWLNVRKIAANEPLWYGRDGEEPFVYEESEWHKKHVRFSDEIQSSDGTSTTLKDGSASNGSSPTDFVGRDVRTSSDGNADDWKEKDELMADGELPRVHGEEACPSPVISRTSRDRASRDRGLRSAGRDTRSAGRGY